MMAASSSSTAQKTWELTNKIQTSNDDSLYKYDEAEQLSIRMNKPWDRDPHYFKEVKISALALLKMVMHARSGGNLEIMGLLQGKVDSNVMIVMDSFALPVEGTETRVNAQAQAYEYMSQYTIFCEAIARKDKVIGWYHSHPGYGCWLSGIDVSTQALNQQYQEPFVAIVVDPIRTISAGKVDIGAFRTYPKGYTPPDAPPSEYQTIPLNKIEDFGVHCNQYYSLDVSYFKSALDGRLLDSLWNTYWVNTLSSTPLLTNASYLTAQMCDLADKLEERCGSIARDGRVVFDGDLKRFIGGDTTASTSNSLDAHLDQVVKDGCKVSSEALHGLIGQRLKHVLFNHSNATTKSIAAAEEIGASKAESCQAEAGIDQAVATSSHMETDKPAVEVK